MKIICFRNFTLFSHLFILFSYVYHIFGLGTQIQPPKVTFCHIPDHMIFIFLYMPGLDPLSIPQSSKYIGATAFRSPVILQLASSSSTVSSMDSTGSSQSVRLSRLVPVHIQPTQKQICTEFFVPHTPHPGHTLAAGTRARGHADTRRNAPGSITTDSRVEKFEAAHSASRSFLS